MREKRGEGGRGLGYTLQSVNDSTTSGKNLTISKSFKKDFILFNCCILIELQSALVVVIKRVKY